MGCVTADQGHILVVDDDGGFRAVCASILAELGHDVSTAQDAWHGRWERERLDAPLLVISDHRMPGDNGLDMLADFVNDRRPGERFVLMSSFLDEAMQEAATATGIDAYCTKPALLEDLERLLATIVAAWKEEVRLENIHV